MAGQDDKRAAIITVHGTGDSQPGPDGEKWWQRGSEFSGWLLEELAARGVEADIHPLIWSGANSATAREEAARDLVKEVGHLAKNEDYASVHIVAHSHGGNVADEAAAMLAWRGGGSFGGNAKSVRDRLQSITAVGTPFFKPMATPAELLGAFGFGLLAFLSAALVAVLILAPTSFLGAVTGDAWFVDDAAIEARNKALARLLIPIGLAGLATLAFVLPIAFRGLQKVRRAGRRARRYGLLAIWHPEDEAISFLQRVEALRVEPFARGSLWRGSRTGGILWGVRAVFVLPTLGLLTLAADWALKNFVSPTPIEFPPYGFGPALLEAVAQQMVLFGVAAAPLVFSATYLAYRAFAYIILERGARGAINNAIDGVLKGVAMGRDGDNRIGEVKPTSHRFTTGTHILGGEVAARMRVGATEAARRLFDKYRAGVFSVDADQTEITREMATDALTWDALIHTTYFDHRYVSELAAALIGERSRGGNNSFNFGSSNYSSVDYSDPENFFAIFRRDFINWTRTAFGTAIGGIVLTAVLAVAAFVAPPIVNRDYLAKDDGVIAPPTEYLAVLEKGADCDVCPEMVVLPGGTFSMGSPTTEEGRFAIEGPMQRVTIQPFAIAKFEVTVEQFLRFATETKHSNSTDCAPFENDLSWRMPGYDQSKDHPVVCVSWEDAQGYVEWLNMQVDGTPYRLPREAEWEYAARAGTKEAFFWGEAAEKGCTYANLPDLSLKRLFGGDWTPISCDDGYVYTSPVGSFLPNSFGLYDMLGNVMEWTEECIQQNLAARVQAPAQAGITCQRVVRGGAARSPDGPRNLRSATRGGIPQAGRGQGIGFRVARTLEP